MAFGDLTTLGDVKAWLQTGANPFPGTDDALLERLITAASQFIVGWLGRPLAAADYIEQRDGTGGHRLQFGCIPVSAVLSLTIDDVAVPPAANAWAAGYVFSSTQIAVRGWRFTRRAQNVVMVYTAGYPTPPPDIAQACIELVTLRYRERNRIGEVSKHLADGATVAFSQKDMSDATKEILQQYRLTAPIGATVPALAPTGTDAGILAGAL